MENKNKELLDDFIKFCEKHPELRFWQALRAWSKQGFIWVSNELIFDGRLEDTFYWEAKDGYKN